MNKIFIKLINYFSKLLFLINRLDDRFLNKFIDQILLNSISSNNVNNFYSIKLVNKKYINKKISSLTNDDLAIIIQGKYVLENNFTFETIKLYNLLFPGAKIILSTWDDINKDEIFKLNKIKCSVIVSSYPIYSGYTNFNLQLITTNAGLNEAKKLNAKFIMKSRTDQRICNRFAAAYLRNLVVSNPPANQKLMGRIFILGMSTYINIPFHIGDMLQFGLLSDIIKLWDIPEHAFNFSRQDHLNRYSMGVPLSKFLFSKLKTPELSLGFSIWEKLYPESICQDFEKNYNLMLREFFGFFDDEQVGLCWPKYTTIEHIDDFLINPQKRTVSNMEWVLFNNGILDKLCFYDPNLLVN